MNQELDYAEMLEIPVNTVNVVKKKSLFKRSARPAKDVQAAQEDLKDLVVDSVNERVGAYVYAEDLSDPPKPEKNKKHATINFKRDSGSVVLAVEIAAACALAVTIFLTNVFMPNSAINTFIGSFSKSSQAEPTYNEMTLSSVVSDFSDAKVSVSESGVLSFTAKGSVYPICDGKVSSVAQTDDTYMVQIAHTSTFSSVITGLSEVYYEKGASVFSNLPFAYSDGEQEVRVSLYDGDTLLNCYTLSGEIPVWNS